MKIFSHFLIDDEVFRLSKRMSNTTIAWTSYIGRFPDDTQNFPHAGGIRCSTTQVLKNGERTFYDVVPRWPTDGSLDKQLDGRRFGFGGWGNTECEL